MAPFMASVFLVFDEAVVNAGVWVTESHKGAPNKLSASCNPTTCTVQQLLDAVQQSVNASVGAQIGTETTKACDKPISITRCGACPNTAAPVQSECAHTDCVVA